jgi:hypothetical protein
VAAKTEWHGDQKQSDELLAALARNCECVFDDAAGKLVTPCPGHLMMTTDQRALDGLLFARYLAATWRKGEFSISALC